MSERNFKVSWIKFSEIKLQPSKSATTTQQAGSLGQSGGFRWLELQVFDFEEWLQIGDKVSGSN